MEHAPKSPERTPEQIRERLAQIDKRHFELTEGLNLVPAPFQESTQGDDDATEAEPTGQAYDNVAEELRRLDQEGHDLRAKLIELEKAA